MEIESACISVRAMGVYIAYTKGTCSCLTAELGGMRDNEGT